MDTTGEHRFYLGRRFDPKQLKLPSEQMALGSPFHLSPYDLLTHAIILGMTGSGKTILGKIIIEEAALQGIPSILIDPKGDLASLKLLFPSLERQDFIPWVEARRGEKNEEMAQRLSELYASKLADFEISRERSAELKGKTKIVVLTPRSTTGVPLAISSLPSPPPNVKVLMQVEPETILGLVDTVARTLVMRLFPGDAREKHRTEEKFLNDIIRYAWENQIALEGIDGLAALVQLVENPPVKKIGVMDVDSYIPPKDRHELAINVNNLLVGVEQLWHMGIQLDIDLILDTYSRDRKTPIIIFNLSEIPSLEDKIFVVSRIAYAIYEWMRRKGGSGEPRLIFYVDEIGGGGGKTAFFPIHPYNPPSKPPLMLLIKQARAFGVCCVFSTQNPGDIDYKGLSNCGTWIIGKLSTARDREKVLQGLGDIELFGTSTDRRRLEGQIASLETGEFICKTWQGDVEFFKERWLMSHHKTMTSKEIRQTTDEADRRIAAVTVSLMPAKRRFLTLNHPVSLEEVKRHFREGVEIHVEKAECRYMPLLSFKIRTSFRKRHPFLSKEIKADFACGPILVPLFKDKVDLDYAAKVLALETTKLGDLLEDSADSSISVVSRKLPIQDVIAEIPNRLGRKIKKEMEGELGAQIGTEEEKSIEAERLNLKPRLDEVSFKIQNTNDQIADLKGQIPQIEKEVGDLEQEKTRRLRRLEPVAMVTKSITSRQRRISKLRTQVSRLQSKMGTLTSQKNEIQETQNRKIELVKEQFGDIRREIFEEMKPELTFEDMTEIFIPICEAAVCAENREMRKSFQLEWNGYNGARITSLSCYECGTQIDRFSSLNLCPICLEFLCEQHALICAYCGNISCKEHSWVCDVCSRTLCRQEKSNLCSVGQHPICEECSQVCHVCGKTVCEKHSIKCHICGEAVCSKEDHFAACAVCGSLICNSCLITCEGCGKPLCPEHSLNCPNCGQVICESCLQMEKRFLGLRKKQKCVLCT